MKQQPGVSDCAVVLDRPKATEKQLVAYVVGDAPADELQNALRQLLPDFMVPAVFIPVASLPLMPNGKLDRNALPEPAFPAQEPSINEVRPYLGLQVQMIEIWRDLLGTHEIGIRDNFFELGGNSLLALRLLHRAEVISGKNVLPAVFFSNPTVEFLAGELARQSNEESPAVLSVNESGSRTPFFYLHGDLFGGGFYSSGFRARSGPISHFMFSPRSMFDIAQRRRASSKWRPRICKRYAPFIRICLTSSADSASAELLLTS